MAIPIELRLLLTAAGALVPRDLRRDWRREWDAEVWWYLQSRGAFDLRDRGRLAVRCCGAFADGWSLRMEEGEGLREMARHPAAWLAVPMLLLVILGMASGGFRHTRQALEGVQLTDAGHVAALFQTGPFMGQRYGVAPAKVLEWNRHAHGAEGAAVYTYNARLATVSAGFFQVLGAKAALGRLFQRDDGAACRDCIVVSHDYWRRTLGGDANVIGRTITMEGRHLRIIGVLPRDFWFLDSAPGIWTESGEFKAPLAGAICRWRTPATLATLSRELHVVPMPLVEIAGRPVATLLPVCLVLLSASSMAAFFLGWRAPKYGAFLVAKTVVALAFITIATVEMGIRPTGLGDGFASLWWNLAGPTLAACWCWRDQGRRCRTCLSVLGAPVRMGHGARMLMEPCGTEWMCPGGHGTLFTASSPAADERWFSGAGDISWSSK